MVALFAWAIYSPSPRPTVGTTFQPTATPVVADTIEAEPPPDPPPSVEAEPVAEPITPAPPLTTTEPPPLLSSTSFVDEPELVPALDAAALVLPVFDIGSTRQDVLDAQGSPPTYSARHERTLWWGSSRVEFDHDGRVLSWTNGTPPLNADK